MVLTEFEQTDLFWELVAPIVADPIAQDNDKRDEKEICTEIPYSIFRVRGQNFPI